MPMNAATKLACDVCQASFDVDDHPVCYESIHLMMNVCPSCIGDYIARYGTTCINCQEPILPHSQVAVYKNEHGTCLLGHTTMECNPAGNTFYGYWGKGELTSVSASIEAC